MFEFTCFRSSHEKLLYQMFFDVETDDLKNSVMSSVLIKLLNPYNSTKEELPLKHFIRKFILKNTSNY